jgi:hypothetical protein
MTTYINMLKMRIKVNLCKIVEVMWEYPGKSSRLFEDPVPKSALLISFNPLERCLHFAREIIVMVDILRFIFLVCKLYPLVN